jgi:hypothetical protein
VEARGSRRLEPILLPGPPVSGARPADQSLERHPGTTFGVERFVHHAHPAFTDAAADLETAHGQLAPDGKGRTEANLRRRRAPEERLEGVRGFIT